MDFVPNAPSLRILPVGQLEKDTSGILLMTNDYNCINNLAHPSFPHIQNYRVVVEKLPSKDILSRISKGIHLPGDTRKTSPIEINVIDYNSSKKLASMEFTIRDNRSKLIRRIMEHVGHPVVQLTRLSFATVNLKDLKPGDHRNLDKHELDSLKKQIKITSIQRQRQTQKVIKKINFVDRD